METRPQTRQLEVDAELELPMARVQLVRLEHSGPEDNMFHRAGIYWVDLCLTPRRPTAYARYVDRWGAHRFAEMGSIIALPPGEHMPAEKRRWASRLGDLPAERGSSGEMAAQRF
jgi:hypothetical protein